MLAQRISDVIKHVQVGEQRAGLKQHAHALADGIQARARHLRYVFTIKQDLAFIGRDLTADQT